MRVNKKSSLVCLLHGVKAHFLASSGAFPASSSLNTSMLVSFPKTDAKEQHHTLAFALTTGCILIGSPLSSRLSFTSIHFSVYSQSTILNKHKCFTSAVW